MGEHEAAAPPRERTWKITVGREDAADPGKISEAGVGRQRQDHQHGGHRQVVDAAAAGDRGNHLRHDALIARFCRRCGADAVGANQHRQAAQ
jgi:hypothetical protein